MCRSGRSADREALLGFAPARTLHRLSFADLLGDGGGSGYQRRFNSAHSLDFRRYVRTPGSATIPLTFNLRAGTAWRTRQVSDGIVAIEVDKDAGPVMAQVDCQHRLGHLADLDVELPFMCFVGLSIEEEVAIFTVINSKARGLSRSLLDYHEARLCEDLGRDRPELFVALALANDPASPWFGQLDVGGSRVSGTVRLASLRTMQKAVRRFILRSGILRERGVEEAARVVIDFWIAVATTFGTTWTRPRGNLLTKGIGVYAMMEVAADLWREAPDRATRAGFCSSLADLADFDWSSCGRLRGLGGDVGVGQALALLRAARARRAPPVLVAA